MEVILNANDDSDCTQEIRLQRKKIFFLYFPLTTVTSNFSKKAIEDP